MVSSIGGVTSKAVEFALDGLTLRHSVIASNIANAGTAGYQPISVDFESKLSELLASDNIKLSSFDWPTNVEPQITLGEPVSTESSSTNFEMNLVSLNQNVIQYQALIKGLSTYMASVSEAIKDGRR